MSILGAFIVPHPPLIIPEIGCGQEKLIQSTIDSYEIISKKIADLKPDTIIFTTPHSILYSDYIHISPNSNATGNFGKFGKPQVRFNIDYDIDFVDSISKLAYSENISAGTLGEKEPELDHGVMVPMYFINKYFTQYKAVRISLSGLGTLSHYNLGKCISNTATSLNKKVVIVSSGDLSHKLTSDGPYGYSKDGPIFDKQVTEAMDKGDFLRFLTYDEKFCESAAECGLRSFIIMAGTLDGKSVNSKLLSYEGPFGVGYAVASFEVTGNDNNRHFDLEYEKIETSKISNIKHKEDPYVKLARNSLETYIKTGKTLTLPNDLPDVMTNSKAGTFVSLKIQGRLRGCIGTISHTTNCIANEIIRNAVSAGTQDPRFPQVTQDELKYIVYSVDILSPSEKINSINDLDVKRYGVIVSHGGKRGLLLPNLEGVDTVEDQVNIALQKGGIDPEADYTLERFEVIRHK